MIWLKTKNKGFTLIELLVVISVIALLSSIVFTSLNSARQKARNVARLSAVRTLVNAFNLSLSDSGSLPISGWACVGLTCYDTWAQYPANPTVDAFLAPSLSKKPSDPIGGSRNYGGYLYINPVTVLGVSGAYIEYTMEPPSSCGSGINLSSGVNFEDCFIKLD